MNDAETKFKQTEISEATSKFDTNRKAITNKYHQEILKELKKHTGKGTKYQKEREKSYDGTTKLSYSIKTSIKEQITKDWLKKHSNPSFSKYLGLLNSLYQGKSHDEIAVAGKLLKLTPKLRGKIEPNSLNKWLDFVEGWAEVDSLCQSNFTAEEILERWREWQSLIISLSEDSNVHKRRASLVLLTKPVRDSTDSKLANLAFAIVDRLKGEKDILITKAVSWLLRDLIKNNRRLVKSYLEKNLDTLPKVAIRETRNKLLTGKK